MFHRLYRSLACAGILIFCSVSIRAERPSLTPEMAHHATGYMEWILDARFDSEQRQHYHEILAGMWLGNDQGARDAIVKMARVHEQLPGISEGERARMHDTMQKEFLRVLETGRDESSRWLMGIYYAAHNSAPQVLTVSAAAPAGAAPLGRWMDGHVSSIQYRNTYTGASAPTNGSRFEYEFKADGAYSFTGLMQSVMYNCTTAIFSNETGSYTVNGNAISLHPVSNPYRMTNNCAPSSNKEKPGKLIARTYRFRITAESGRRYLELQGEDGKVQKLGESR
jgi:hypothetical protein